MKKIKLIEFLKTLNDEDLKEVFRDAHLLTDELSLELIRRIGSEENEGKNTN